MMATLKQSPLSLVIKLLLVAAFCYPFVASATTNSIPLPSLPQNSRLMFMGDSITETAPTPTYVEIYLLACAGRKDVKMLTAGHSGETSGSLISRQVDLQCFNPSIVLFNWGMNDTGYSPYTAQKGASFAQNTQASFDLLAGKGITGIVAGPGNVAPNYSTAQATTDQNYCLGQFSALGRTAAAAKNAYFSDIYNRMADACTASSAVYGTTYGYGVHSEPNGCLLMAHEDLKTLACTGSIGNINVDMSGTATASAGHTVVSFSHGAVVLDSTQYPFCYNYDSWYSSNYPKNSLASMLPFDPFSQELNRFILTVTNLGAASADVTWGGLTKSFTSAQLAAGVNLADQFSQTPFDATFAQVMAAIVRKQHFENFMTKGTSNFFGNDNGGNVDNNMIAIQEQLDTAVKALIIPVRHTIAIVPTGTSGPAAPIITGTMMVYPTVGYPFTYQTLALNLPTSFTVTPALPNGLTMNSSGQISGTPTTAGTTEVTISATNTSGTASTKLTLTVAAPIPNAPGLTSPTTATATVGVPFSYQITATNNPTAYFVTTYGSQGTGPSATSLPPGLTYDSSTGLLSGTPTQTGTYSQNTGNSMQVAAMNGATDVSSMLISLTVAGSGQGGGAPSAPTGLSATAANAQVALSWTVSSGATSYNIYRGTSAGGENATAIMTGVATNSFTDTGLTNGTPYYYKVSAVNVSGTSGYSNEAGATPSSGGGIPSVPTGLTATAGNAQATLNWTPASGATSYNLYRSTLTGAEGDTPVATGITSTSYIDSPLPNGPTQYYKVAAVNSSGTSGYSNEASASPAAGSGSGTTTGVISVVYGSATAITGGVSAGFVPETIWNNDPCLGIAYFGAGSTTLSNLTDSNNANSGISETLTTWAGYHTGDAITGFSAVGNNNLYSHGPFIQTPGKGGLLTLSGLNASLTYDLYIYVNDPNGAADILSSLSDSLDSQSCFLKSIGNSVMNNYVLGSATTAGTAAAGNYFKLTGLTGATMLSAQITSASGVCIDGFQLVVHNAAAAPSTPAGLTAAPGSGVGQIALNWTASTGAQNYLLQRSTTSGGGYTTLATIAAPTVTYTDNDPSLVAGQNYYYQIAAVNTCGTSAFSSFAVSTPYVPATFSGWAYTYFGLNSTQTGVTANPAHDGLSNLLKYALGLDPLSPATFQPTLTLSGSTWQFTFQRPANRTDITYSVQISPDLSAGSWTAGGVNLARIATGDPETWQATRALASESKLFFRLQITWP